MKKKKSKRSKQKSHDKVEDEPIELKKAPHTFVIHRGLACKLFGQKKNCKQKTRGNKNSH
jgi:hypothetical protein